MYVGVYAPAHSFNTARIDGQIGDLGTEDQLPLIILAHVYVYTMQLNCSIEKFLKRNNRK